jgi:hypothetical protein
MNGPMMTLAAEPARRPTAGGVATLLIGIALLAVGVPLATNFRGALNRLDWTPKPVPRLLQKLPPWRWEGPDNRAVFRFVAVGLAVVGLVCVPLGIYRIATGTL